MTSPSGYDAWRLSGPDDDRPDCKHCGNTGDRECPDCENPPDDMNDCPECCGTGYVACDCELRAADDADDHGEWLLERHRDRLLDGVT